MKREDIIVFSFGLVYFHIKQILKCSQNNSRCHLVLLGLHTLPPHFPYFFRNYAAMIGVVSHDFFTELSNTEMEEGIAREQRDQMLQVNSYHIILIRINL